MGRRVSFLGLFIALAYVLSTGISPVHADAEISNFLGHYVKVRDGRVQCEAYVYTLRDDLLGVTVSNYGDEKAAGRLPVRAKLTKLEDSVLEIKDVQKERGAWLKEDFRVISRALVQRNFDGTYDVETEESGVRSDRGVIGVRQKCKSAEIQ